MWACCDDTSSDDDEHNTSNNLLLWRPSRSQASLTWTSSRLHWSADSPRIFLLLRSMTGPKSPQLRYLVFGLQTQVMTRELLYILCKADQRQWSVISKCAWELFSEQERKMEELGDDQRGLVQ